MSKTIYLVGGGTISHVRNHLALCAPAYGRTAIQLEQLCQREIPGLNTKLCLTRMAGGSPELNTPKDLGHLVSQIVNDPDAKIVFWTPAVVDFHGWVDLVPSGAHAERLDSSGHGKFIQLAPQDKLVSRIRESRKELFLIACKTTTGASPEEQYLKGLTLLKKAKANLVLANDVITRHNMIIVPEEATYGETTDRAAVLLELVKITDLRSQLSFTRSQVLSGELVPWHSPMVPDNLRTVVSWCIAQGAYQRFLGVTVGHFAARLNSTEFLTSKRRTDFNEIWNTGLVHIRTDGPDNVFAVGGKPSVGGQSQRIVFDEHPDLDCIVHFHCGLKEGSEVPTVSQREFECGSHECGRNTANGLKKFGPLWAVYLDKHGPNIVFSKNTSALTVIEFIQDNFDLTQKTGGYQVEVRPQPLNSPRKNG